MTKQDELDKILGYVRNGHYIVRKDEKNFLKSQLLAWRDRQRLSVEEIAKIIMKRFNKQNIEWHGYDLFVDIAQVLYQKMKEKE